MAEKIYSYYMMPTASWRELGSRNLNWPLLVAVTSILMLYSTDCLADPNGWSPPEGSKQLAPNEEIWLNAKQNRVYVNGMVVLREGVLEMFACPKGTKEHESVIAVKTKAFLIHTALLAVGAEPGSPVKFEPKFVPPNGTEIGITLEWLDEANKLQSAKAQDWIRNLDTKEPMKLPFVFAGSGFWTDPDTGKQRYLAEAGDLICVSNFGSAMIDVPIESTQSNEGLLFEPFTDRIPPEGTPVRMILTPVIRSQAAEKP